MSGSIIPWTSEYEDYLRDESRRIGTADSISFPTSEAEVIEVVKEVRAQGGTITVQGARTGIVAGAVPQGGHVLNLSRMNRIGDVSGDSITAEPGAILENIREAIEKEGLFFPPDPTETTASIGGMVACNASGALTFRYGPTRNWVQSLRMVLSDGDLIAVRRGQCLARGRSFSLATEGGRTIGGDLPSYSVPNVKSASGYYVADDMDILDLLVGMEGTLGIITEVELKLIRRPGAINGLTVFLPTEEAALKLVRILREQSPMRPVGIEFFNHDALYLLRRMRSESSAFERIPALKPDYHTAVYAEFHADAEEEIEEPIMALMEAIVELGGSDEDTWYATNDRELEPLKAFRHAIPEAVNLLIDQRKRDCPELTKLGTDMSVPDARLEEVIAMYGADLESRGLESVVFGHVGNNHVHVNILPRSIEEYEKGKMLYLDWARQIVGLGGSVSAEHGIGKIKVPLLRMMYGDEAVAEMRSLRLLFDPDEVLNRGSLF